MLEFIKKCFFTGLTFLSTLTSVNPLSCISMSNQECKVRPQIVNVSCNKPVFFFLLVLKEVNIVVVVTISMTPLWKYVFLML